MNWAVPFCLLMIVSISCAPKKKIAMQAAPAPPALSRTADWIDLQSGWRLRVTTPIVEGGGYSLKTKPALGNATMTMNADQTAATITMTSGEDFLGYEIAYYSLETRRGGGLNTKLKSVERHLNKQPVTTPVTPLFPLPSTLPYVRLLHMLRVSDSDHDDALLSGVTLDDLKLITEQVQTDPAACRNIRRASCSWIPTGVAILPQGNVGTPTAEKWVGLP